MKKYKLGIDVGGTFTDAVLIDSATLKIVDKSKILTTHSHKNGVAEGVVNAIDDIIKRNKIKSDQIQFIAHGTTQATNALLEGDVAKVGVIGIVRSSDKLFVKPQIRMRNIPLGNNKFIHVYTEFIDVNQLSTNLIDSAVKKLKSKGVETFAASQPFSVDEPAAEKFVMARLYELGENVTSGHYVSSLYGLQTRTKTAVVNASLLPKMIETADMTQNAIMRIGIKKELMIMRSDGGVMSITEVKKRPILTMLSGLAAGVAGALMYSKLSDGIFFEVGGTSIDISAVKNGKVLTRNATIGKMRTSVDALDIRTLAIAGGSMIKLKDGKVSDVGPRSAHIAKLEYEAFSDLPAKDKLKVTLLQPTKEDAKEYAVLTDGKNSWAYTLAGAANYLGFVPKEDYAKGKDKEVLKAWEVLGKHLNQDPKAVAEQVMNIALAKVEKVVNELIKTYKLNKNIIKFIGGGGSAAVTTFSLGKKMGIPAEVAKDAPYISTIGVALAMVKDVIKRNIVNPTETDIKKIKNEAVAKVIALGANPSTIEVDIEVDKKKNIVVATATGSTEIEDDKKVSGFSDEEIVTQLKRDHRSLTNHKFVKKNDYCKILNIELTKKVLGFKRVVNLLKIYSPSGAILFQGENYTLKNSNPSVVVSDVAQIIEDFSSFDAGFLKLPEIRVIIGHRVLNLTQLHDENIIKSILELEVSEHKEIQDITIIYRKA